LLINNVRIAAYKTVIGILYDKGALLMAEYSKCPHCGASISKLKANQMPAEYKESGMINTDSRNCWVYSCPQMSCGKIISVQHDPIEQRNALAKAIADLVAKMLRA